MAILNTINLIANNKSDTPKAISYCRISRQLKALIKFGTVKNVIHTWNSTCSCTLFVTTRDLFFSHHRANWDVTLVLLYTILSARSEVDLNRLYKYRPRFTHLKLKKAALITIRFLIRFLKKLLAVCEHECGKGVAVYLIYAKKKLFYTGSLSFRAK